MNKGIFNRISAENHFSPKNFAQYLENKITDYLNSGYPFVNVQLKNVTIISNQISSSLHISKGKYSVLKKIHIKGDSSISINTIQSIIGISIGDAYSENAISIIDDKIAQNNFINTIKPSEILYTNEGHEIFLYVKSDRASFCGSDWLATRSSKSENGFDWRSKFETAEHLKKRGIV